MSYHVAQRKFWLESKRPCKIIDIFTSRLRHDHEMDKKFHFQNSENNPNNPSQPGHPSHRKYPNHPPLPKPSSVLFIRHFPGDCLLRIAGFWSWALFAPKLAHLQRPLKLTLINICKKWSFLIVCQCYCYAMVIVHAISQ